ncbi:MAG: GTP 3',8-cyclase MoaA [Pseudomonadota bacterium]|nr:GTP 3',8-cyclase MoaA [Pseudomonadota bacterium]
MSDVSLVDPFARVIRYVRLSVTDRCDFRCVYCMSEKMTFLPRDRLLTLEEIARLGRIFASLGVQTFRLTGGEPLVRRNLPWLVTQLAQQADVVMTSNGSRLDRFAQPLKDAGMSRINVSLDSLDPQQFRAITRTGELADVLRGIEAAQQVGFTVKLNVVVMKGRNDSQILPIVAFAQQRGLDVSFIEEMPLGQISEHSRLLTFMPSAEIRALISQHYDLIQTDYQTQGPSRYVQLADSATRIGFISPHSHNFCGDCNRVRVTSEGRLLLCLGNEQGMDLLPLLRDQASDSEIASTILQALTQKPERHDFDLTTAPQIVRFMNMTGG